MTTRNTIIKPGRHAIAIGLLLAISVPFAVLAGGPL